MLRSRLNRPLRAARRPASPRALRGLASAACAGLLVVLAAEDARAEERLLYRAPDGCPGEGQVRDQFRTVLEHRRLDVSRTVMIVIEERADRFVGTLSIEDDGSRRQRILEASTCRDVVDGLFVVLSLGGEERASKAREEDPPPARPAPVAVTPPPPRWFLALGAGVTTGLQPHVAPTGRLSGGASFARLVLEGYATALLPNHAGLDGRVESATFVAATFGARACFAFAARFIAGPCVGAEASWLRGSGAHAHDVHDRTATTVSPTLSLRASVFLREGLALSFDATGAAPIQRPEFTFDGQSVHRESALVFRGTAGAELWF